MPESTFAEWLRRRALAAGYDIDGARGAQAALAKATGISPTQIGRTFNGQTMPDVSSQLRLARVLEVEFSEILIRSGFAEPSDFPAVPAPRQVDVFEAAQQWGVSDADAPIISAVVEQLQKRKPSADALQAIRNNVADIAYQLAQLELDGDVPEIVSALHQLVEDLDDVIHPGMLSPRLAE